MLQWIDVNELLVDPSYQRPITGRGRKHVSRIAASFSWSCFTPVVVSPIEGGKFAIIDGQHRTTAAALIGLKSVPCQIVIIPRKEQAAAFRAINGVTAPISRIALHAAALVYGDNEAVRVGEIAACAGVEILRYPLPAKKQQPGQTMAIGVIYKCSKRYGRDVVITALQCITQTSNNKPGALGGNVISGLCNVLGRHAAWRDAGLKLLDAFDAIDLTAIQDAAVAEAAVTRGRRDLLISKHIQAELEKRLPLDGSSHADPAVDDRASCELRRLPPSSRGDAAGGPGTMSRSAA